MPLEIRVKVVKIGNSLRMTIPKEVAGTMALKPGDILLVGLDDSHMTVRKAK